jgi:hypothetical protein
MITRLDVGSFSNSKNMDIFSKLYDYIEKYDASPHRFSRQHVDALLGKNKMYRWFDYELIRRKLFRSNDSDY